MTKRILSTLFCLGIITLLGVWVWEKNPKIAETIKSYFDKGDHLTLEARFTPDEIMKNNRSSLIVDDGDSFREAKLKYHPYLIIDAQYTTPSGKKKEGTLLWSMIDGEMVLNTDTWDKSHGFQEALLANASQNEFKIITTLAKNGGKMGIVEVEKELNIDNSTLTPLVASAQSKHLMKQQGDILSLHFQDANIPEVPKTKINHWLETKLYNHTQRLPKRFSFTQIERLAKGAYGDDFTIRSIDEIAVPVYSIEVVGSDGSLHTSFWNGVSGKQINPRSLAY